MRAVEGRYSGCVSVLLGRTEEAALIGPVKMGDVRNPTRCRTVCAYLQGPGWGKIYGACS